MTGWQFLHFRTRRFFPEAALTVIVALLHLASPRSATEKVDLVELPVFRRFGSSSFIKFGPPKAVLFKHLCGVERRIIPSWQGEIWNFMENRDQP